MEILVNGCPVIMSLSLVTESGEGWKGYKFLGAYTDMESLSEAINKLDVPLYWQIEVDFQDKIEEVE